MISHRRQRLVLAKILAWFMCYHKRISRYHPKSLSFEGMDYDRLGRLYDTENPKRRIRGYEVVINTNMIAGGRYTDRDWKNVLLHELAHACHDNTRRHGMSFRRNCRRLGVEREYRGRSLS